MGLVFQIHDVSQLDEGVWKARLTPSDIKYFDTGPVQAGGRTILLLSEAPLFNEKGRSLSFDPATARVLTAGGSGSAIVIAELATRERVRTSNTSSTAPERGTGDTAFLQSLPADLKELGKELLHEVRKEFSGDLRFFPKSGKFIEKPDNFWTIRPQPRDGSFRITVRGRPESFTKSQSLEVKPDMPGYSSFKISRQGQLVEVMELMRQVRRK